MSPFLQTLRRMLHLMVGQPDYDAYLRHMREQHPGHAPMDRITFFRNRQEARYGGKNGGKCC